MSLTFIEVCAGAGGLSSGLMKEGFVPLLLNDNNKDCCATLVKNHPGVQVVCGSMDDLDLSEFRSQVDLLTGGVPCQSFSQAGKRKGLEDPRGKLMMRFAQLIKDVNPKMFMVENVKGLVNHNKGKTLQDVIAMLNPDALYDVQYKILNAMHYSVAQKRERVIIIGTLKSANLSFAFPEQHSTIKVLKDVLVNVPVSRGAKYSQIKMDLYKHIPQGGCWVNLPVALQKEYMGKSFESGGGKRGILHRLSMDRPSLTILCSPSQKQTERCHPLEDRPLTVRETARIQSFDDTYEFVGSMASEYKQIGNAVPVELARSIGVSIKQALQNTP